MKLVAQLLKKYSHCVESLSRLLLCKIALFVIFFIKPLDFQDENLCSMFIASIFILHTPEGIQLK